MRAFLSAAVVLVGIAVVATFALQADQQNSSRAFKSSNARLDPVLITNDLGRMPPHTEQK